MSEQRKDNIQIKFRVSEYEYQELSASAVALGMSVPKFCKNLAQNRRLKAPLIDRTGALEIAGQLRKIGGNVNQLAHHANVGGRVDISELQFIQKELGEIWHILSLALQNQPID